MSRASTTVFDPARYLESAEAQADLLADALATGSAGYIANALGIIARAKGMTSVAKEAGIAREALYRSLSEDGDPQLTTLLGVAKALGLEMSFVPRAKRKKNRPGQSNGEGKAMGRVPATGSMLSQMKSTKSREKGRRGVGSRSEAGKKAKRA